MFERFRDIVVSGGEKMVKPHAALYRLVPERFGPDAGEAVFVDDKVANAAGAEAVGLTALAFTDAATLRARLVEPGLLD